jgi:hypothetical protein
MTDATIYSGANTERNNLGIVSLGFQKTTLADIVVEPQPYLAESVISFSYDVENKDSVYDIRFWALPLYVGQILFDGAIVYDVSDRLIKKYTSGNLSVVSIHSLLTETIPHIGSKLALVVTQLTIKRDALQLLSLEKQKDLLKNCCEYDEWEKVFRAFNYVKSLRSGAYIHFCRGNYLNAQEHLETGNDFGLNFLVDYP